MNCYNPLHSLCAFDNTMQAPDQPPRASKLSDGRQPHNVHLSSTPGAAQRGSCSADCAEQCSVDQIGRRWLDYQTARIIRNVRLQAGHAAPQVALMPATAKVQKLCHQIAAVAPRFGAAVWPACADGLQAQGDVHAGPMQITAGAGGHVHDCPQFLLAYQCWIPSHGQADT